MFSEKLRRLRRERGYTQQSFARQLGTASSTVGMYEQGRRKPSEDTLCQMGKLLHVPVEYLLAEEQEEPEEENMEELISDIKARLLERNMLILDKKSFSA